MAGRDLPSLDRDGQVARRSVVVRRTEARDPPDLTDEEMFDGIWCAAGSSVDAQGSIDPGSPVRIGIR
jgi:hypothetical protein